MTSDTLRELANEWVNKIFLSEESNFLKLGKLGGLVTSKGSNNLNSCLQFEVKEQDGERLLNIKAYDKFLDLVGREHTYLVGSRLSKILGSGSQPGEFEK